MTDIATFEHDPRSPRQARRFVVNHLSGCEPEAVDRASLMISELATNSVRHASGPFTVTVALTSDALRIEVSDAGPAAPVMRSPSSHETSGRGLRIVAELADDWGMHSRPDTGNVVWFCLQLGTASAPSQGAVEAVVTSEMPLHPTGSARAIVTAVRTRLGVTASLESVRTFCANLPEVGNFRSLMLRT